MQKKNLIKTLKVEKSVGKILLHDITSIVPGKFKGPAFKKGHIIRDEDIPKLKDLGKEKIYVFEIPENEYHEDEAAELFKKFAGKNVRVSGPSEGKLTFSSETSGLVQIDRDTVIKINSIGDIAFTTIHSNVGVSKGDNIAGIRIIPLTIKKKAIDKALSFGSVRPLTVRPFKKKKVALIVAGSEIANGRIKDSFKPIIEKKVKRYNSSIDEFKILSDNVNLLKKELLNMRAKSCTLIILTGGMSVDPDDTTKTAIREAGVDIISYGAPILPGNMFLVGYIDDVAVLGVPACALYHNITVLDLFLPYIFSDTKITKVDIINRGYGGYCRHCAPCNFPRCGFGK